MPQIRCPNCGLTINLENRKDTDIDMITDAVKHDANTFTGLLRATKLPRKTLSIRLKELIANGTLSKFDGTYALAGSIPPMALERHFSRFSNAVHDKRMRGFIMLGLMLIAFPTVSYVLASLVAGPVQHIDSEEPKLLGSFMAEVQIQNVKDLYAWQVVIAYNSSQLKVVSAESGEFIEAEIPFFTMSTDNKNTLLVGATLQGDRLGIDGSGTLAKITFGYYIEDYSVPHLAGSAGGFETYLLNSNEQRISAGLSLT